MGILLAVDPGADAGWAFFDDGRLIGCGLGTPRQDRPDRVVIEKPMIYPGGRQEVPPNDLITLAVRAGEVGGAFRALGAVVDYVLPRTWKNGPIPKDVMHKRILRRLDDAERALIDVAGRGMAPSKRHNMLDAVGIGLWGLRRLAI